MQHFSLSLLLSTASLAQFIKADPIDITFRGGVLHAPPFATVEEQSDGSFVYGGVQADMVERLKMFAAEDNIRLNFELSPSPPQYGTAFDLVANDCNTTEKPYPLEECEQFDVIVANFYSTPSRALRSELSPAWLRSTISTMKYTEKTKLTDVTTMEQASNMDVPVCLKAGTFYAGVVEAKFPKITYIPCDDQDICISKLKNEECGLYASDELQLRFRAANDITIEVTPESFNTQYITWAIKDNIPNARWLRKWLYQAVTNTTMDELYFKYFQKELCPVGTAGERCELPCDPDHGEADESGYCVCRSTKWAGDDCSIEVLEDTNLIRTSLKTMAYTMVGINFVTILALAGWLFWKRGSTQVRLSQPFFLCLVLLGCLISTSTILAMVQEDPGDGPVRACMAIPWLYSVGFSITFGCLFAKIRRVYLIFKSAADFRRSKVTLQETFGVTAAVLVIDLIILLIWTFVDPLEWRRTVTATDKFGERLESEGFCTCDHWEIWVGSISCVHLGLLAVACFLCYQARDIPTQFSEGKYVSIAMFSNLQIFVVAVPILIILGSDPEASFFVRAVVIWMNDFVVVILIFGNLIYNVHFIESGGVKDDKETVSKTIGSAIQQFTTAQKERSVRMGRGSFLSSSRLSSSRMSGSKFDRDGILESVIEDEEKSSHFFITPKRADSPPAKIIHSNGDLAVAEPTCNGAIEDVRSMENLSISDESPQKNGIDQ